MATSITASSTNTARSAGEGNEPLDLRDTDASEQESSSDDNGSSTDDLAPSGHEQASQGKDGLSEALKAERRRSSFALQIVDCHRRYSHQGSRGGDG